MQQHMTAAASATRSDVTSWEGDETQVYQRHHLHSHPTMCQQVQRFSGSMALISGSMALMLWLDW
jgi:hypothetical protein